VAFFVFYHLPHKFTPVKKMLVPFDEKKPGKNIRDFIHPFISESEACFIGIKKPKKWKLGRVVYTGVDVTANDIFAEIVDEGTKIDDVDSCFIALQEYVSQLSEFSIGNILAVQKDGHRGFRLIKHADRIQLSGTSKIP
jgi:hypothetical protein